MTAMRTQEEIKAWQDLVWESEEMREAGRRIETAKVELSDKGWGSLSLESAKTELLAAVALIERMEKMA